MKVLQILGCCGCTLKKGDAQGESQSISTGRCACGVNVKNGDWGPQVSPVYLTMII